MVLLGALSAFGPLSIDMYLPAFPEIGRDLGAEPGQVQATLSAFFAALTLGQLLLGSLSDRFGRRGPLLAGLLLYAGTSVGCALAGDIRALTALRFLQAFGACAGMVLSRAIVTDLYEPPEAIRAYATLMLISGLAPMLAPTLGGLLLSRFGWRGIFWLLTGIGTACFASVLFLLPETNRHRGLSGGIGATLRVYRDLAANREFLGYTLIGAAGSVGMFAYITGSSFVFIELFGVSAAAFGLYFGLNALGMTLGSQSNRLLARWATPRQVLRFGTLAQGIAGGVLLLGALSGLGGLAGIALPLFVYQVCNGVVFPNTTALAMAESGRAAGSASALIGTLQFFLAALSSALLSAISARSALPMSGLVALSGLLGVLLFRRVAGGASGKEA